VHPAGLCRASGQALSLAPAPHLQKSRQVVPVTKTGRAPEPEAIASQKPGQMHSGFVKLSLEMSFFLTYREFKRELAPALRKGCHA